MSISVILTHFIALALGWTAGVMHISRRFDETLRELSGIEERIARLEEGE